MSETALRTTLLPIVQLTEGGVLKTKVNVAGRVGRWSIRHRRAAIIGWFVFVLAAFMVGGNMGVVEKDPASQGVGESGHASQIYEQGWPREKQGNETVSEQVLIESKTHNAHDPAFKATVHDVMTRLDRDRYVGEIESPYAKHENPRIAQSGHAAVVKYELQGDIREATKRVEQPMESIAAAEKAHSGFTAKPVGDASLEKAMADTDGKDFQRAEISSLPLTLLILVLTFGAVVAAGVPVLLAMTAVFAAMGLMAPASHISPVAGGYESVILLIGLAVGVDYSLFYIRRAREMRAAGYSNDEAIEIAASTSGRAVLVSGLTVMVSMAGMYFAGISMFESFATATILVVAAAVLGSLTVLPALLSKLGDRIEKGRLPGYGFMRAKVAKLSIWSRITDRVLRRPLVSAIVAGSLLVALAVPALSMHTALPGTESMSRDVEVVRTWDHLQEEFPSQALPVMVAVKADDVTKGQAARAIAKFERSTQRYPSLYTGRASVDVSDNKQVASIQVPAAGDGTEAISQKAMRTVRDDLAPAAFDGVAGLDYATTGNTAAIDDFNQSLKSHMPYVFGFVVISAFLLLLVTFRSLVIPIKAILLNVLSVGAAYGLLVLVFQKGWGESLLGFESTGAVTAWLPPFLFVILFGLSMDYHVFILSRIRESVDRGMSTDEAVSRGIKVTAGVVTSAAVIMVGVFSIFGTLSSIDMKQMGVGLAAAVLIDATIIRGVLLPATMKLLGERNWWLPRPLRFLPEVSSHEEVAPAQA
jgi:RND superfamily putative drug exporter